MNDYVVIKEDGNLGSVIELSLVQLVKRFIITLPCENMNTMETQQSTSFQQKLGLSQRMISAKMFHFYN